jgi:hypothetical protein
VLVSPHKNQPPAAAANTIDTVPERRLFPGEA